MMQCKDPAIKLFGKTIPIRAGTVFDDDEFGGVSAVASSAGSELGAAEKEKVSEERIIVKGLKQEGEDESVNENITLEANENQINALRNDETVNPNNRSSDISEEANSEERTPLKKPDKVLQCPRCESMSTKFCYYNNYNVLQPRHFCKGCQRYWTAGGSMRNVKDGAGRRRSKNYALQKHYLTISEVLQASGAGSPNGTVPGHQGLKCGSVSTVDSDATVCASTGSVSNLKVLFGANLTHKVNEVVVIKPHDVGEINSSGSCITASNETESKHHANTSPVSSFNGSEAQMPCIPAWPYPWNAVIRPPALQHPGFSLPFVHPNYWPCTAIPNTWNAPWLTPQSLWQTNADVGGNPNSKPSVLGKHSRDGGVLQRDTSERQASPKQISVLTPKTLRIVHPEEAAKSSIWKTLGIKNEIISNAGF